MDIPKMMGLVKGISVQKWPLFGYPFVKFPEMISKESSWWLNHPFDKSMYVTELKENMYTLPPMIIEVKNGSLQ